MKKYYVQLLSAIFITSLFMALLGIHSCYPIGDGGSVFYMCDDCALSGTVYVYVDGHQVGTIDGLYTPLCSQSCKDSQSPTYNAPAGDHVYTVTDAAGAVLDSGSFTITKQKCSQVKLRPRGCSAANGGGGGGGGGGSGCNYSLTGTWTRQNDGGCTNCAGMVVYFNGTSGVIQSVNSGNSQGFYTGQTKWQNFSAANCTMDDLNMPSASFNNYSISFTNANTVVLGGSITYTK